MQGFDWNDLRFVLALARCQTLLDAARQLGVNESTVGRHITQAEGILGSRLFECVQGAFQPTTAGNQVVAEAERVEALIHGLESSVSGADKAVAGTVRVTSVPMIVNRILVPALPALLEQHSQLRVELIADPRDLSLTRRETDLALRLARPIRELGTIARRIGRLDYAVYEPILSPAEGDLWITYEDKMADLPQCQWIIDQMNAGTGRLSSLKVNDAEAIISALRAGIGCSVLPIAVGDKISGIRRRNNAKQMFSRELWLLTHPDIRTLVRIKVVTDWLVSKFEQLTSSAGSDLN